MLTLAWSGLLVVGLAITFFASSRAVGHARALVQGTGAPPFLVGITLMAVGTDLPEIANSLVSCLVGHGDLNAGNALGSAVTQTTLVLGLLPLLAGSFVFRRRHVCLMLGACAVAVLLVAGVGRDGFLSRLDGALLVAAWVGGSLFLWRYLEPSKEALPLDEKIRGGHAPKAMVFLALVGIGAALAVAAFIELAEMLSVPEFILSFFAAAIGTSLPELVVDVTALRRGLRDVALGDVLGSSFVDATLSIGIGPMFAPVAVSAALVVRGSFVAVVAFAAVAVLLASVRRHGRVSGALLLLVYAGVYVALLAGAR